jgi:hypothetical protein
MVDAFHHTTVVTVSPRLIFVNHVDPVIAAAFRAAAAAGDEHGGAREGGAPPALLDGSAPSPSSTGSPADDIGVFVIQIAQAAPHSEDGASRPAAPLRRHLEALAAPGL